VGADDPYWGCWQLPESMAGMDAIELGCGTGYVSGWLRLFRDTGFEVLDYLELQVPSGSPDRFSTPGDWAHQWPAEQVWKLRKQ